MCNAMEKYKILLIVEILILLILIPLCFRQEKLVYSVSDVSGGIEAGISVFEGERFTVRPGVYQVRAYTEVLQDGYVYVHAACDDSSFRAFRCNGEVLYPDQNYQSFEVYVSEKIDSAYVTLSFNSENQAIIDSLEVYRVNLGERMLAFLFVLGSIGLDFLLVFRDGILSGRVKKEQQVVFWGLLLSILLAYFPYMTDYFSGAADISFHWMRIEGLTQTLRQGNQFPVRVQSYWLYDHGYAVSSFYGDLFLLIPVFFRFSGFSLMSAYKMFVFVVMAATAVIAYYSFKRCTKHTYAALFGSIIYMLAPYRIYNFYNRGAVGEYLAMAFLPLVICGMYRLYTEDVENKSYKNAKIPLILGLSCILNSHLLTCEMTVVFMLAICIVFFKKTFRKQTFMQLVQAAVICLLVNAWFWVPLLKMMASDTYFLSGIISKDIQYMGTWFAEIFQLYPNQGAAQSGMYNAEPFQMGIASLIMLVTVLVVLIRNLVWKKREDKNPYDKIMIFWSVLVLFSWFMSTRYFPWDMISQIPVIQFLATALQFPTRLFSPVSVFCGVSAAFFFLWFEYECKERIADETIVINLKKGIMCLLLILAAGSALYHVNDIAYNRSPIWLYNAENMGTVSVVNGEYMLEGTAVGDYHYHGPIADEGLEWSEYDKNGTSIELSLKNTTNAETFAELPLIGYKGYALKGDGGVLPYITEERGAHGDLRIAVPGGYEGSIEVYYKGFLSFRIAEAISALTMAAIIAWWIYKRRLQWKARTK